MFFLWTDVLSQDCRNEIIALEKKLYESKVINKDKVQYLDLEVINKLEENQKIISKTIGIKMYMSYAIVHYESQFFSMYYDSTDFFLVLHNERMIFRKAVERTIKEEDLQSYYRDYLNAFNSFIEQAESVSCKLQKVNDYNYVKMFELKLKPDNTNKIAVIRYFYDLNEARLTKIHTIFKNNKPLLEQTVFYKKIEPDYKGRKLKPAIEMIYKSPGKLQPKYYNYTIINE
jgi:hypothetical protein